MFKLHIRYLLLTLLLLLTEVLIALFVNDTFVRPYGGDTLVVILMYCFVRSFTRWPVLPTVTGVLCFSFVVEASQYFKLIRLLGLEQSTLAQMILGNSFSWKDIAAYLAGAIIILAGEFMASSKKRTDNNLIAR